MKNLQEHLDGKPLHDLFVKRLAIRFSANLEKEIGREDLTKALALNLKEPEGSGVCHTHDFCDSNMAMHATFHEMLGIDDSDEESPILELIMDGPFTKAWNDAWAMARRKSFYLTVGMCDHLYEVHASGFARECSMCGTLTEIE